MNYPLLRLVPFICMTLVCRTAYAGGLLAYEIASPDLGLASAGYAARAQDAATAMTNPAGMLHLPHSEIMVGIQPLYGDLQFTANTETTVTGNDGNNAVGWFPGGAGFGVYAPMRDLRLGLAVYGNFGLPLHYNGGWVGRYYTTESTLLGITIAPSIAYRVHEFWSLGIAINAMYGILSEKTAVNNSPNGAFGIVPDGELAVNDHTWGYGLTFGFMFEATQNIRYGLTYTTSLSLDFDNNITFEDVYPVIIPTGNVSVPINLGITVPKQVMFSFYHGWTPDIAFLGNIGWQNWEQFDKVNLIVWRVNPNTLTQKLHFDDTWHGALGLQINIFSDWQLSFGAAYDTDMVNASERSVSLPIGPTWRLGMGLQYQGQRGKRIGVGYTRLSSPTLGVNEDHGVLTGRVAGTYERPVIHYVGIFFTQIASVPA